jgi:palmitoyltransferase
LEPNNSACASLPNVPAHFPVWDTVPQGLIAMVIKGEDERQSAMEIGTSRALAVILPLLELAAIAHATYVVVYLICVNYLMDPSKDLRNNGVPSRNATGIGLLVVYCLLLLPFLITYMRLLQVIWKNPGLVPLGDPSWDRQSAPTKHFERYDAYICDHKGMPIWCEECHNWKPDRTHHDSHTGRCVRKMDHFCPWAGGIIGETTYKFFVQFLFYGFVYTGYMMIVIAYFLAERSKLANGKPVNWVIALALSALFFLFTFGMFMTTFYNMSLNFTTVEIMQRDRIHHLAIHGNPRTTSSNSISSINLSPSRSYHVVQTEGIDHPWDLGPVPNMTSVMGHSLLEWLVPLKMSPCTNHNNAEGEFEWSSAVHALRR